MTTVVISGLVLIFFALGFMVGAITVSVGIHRKIQTHDLAIRNRKVVWLPRPEDSDG